VYAARGHLAVAERRSPRAHTSSARSRSRRRSRCRSAAGAGRPQRPAPHDGDVLPLSSGHPSPARARRRRHRPVSSSAHLWAGQYLPAWHPWADYRRGTARSAASAAGCCSTAFIRSTPCAGPSAGGRGDGHARPRLRLEIDTEDIAAMVLRLAAARSSRCTSTSSVTARPNGDHRQRRQPGGRERRPALAPYGRRRVDARGFDVDASNVRRTQFVGVATGRRPAACGREAARRWRSPPRCASRRTGRTVRLGAVAQEAAAWIVLWADAGRASGSAT
jgi:hypothetical protein